MTRRRRVQLADPLGTTERLVGQLTGFAVERVAASAWPELGRDEPAAVLVAGDLGSGRAGVELVREVVAAGRSTPVLLLAPKPGAALEAQALAAGAVTVVDLSRAESQELDRMIQLLWAGRHGVEERYTRLLDHLAAWLVYDGRNALAGIGSATRIVSDELPEDSPGRLLCDEIRVRTDQFRERLETVVLAMRPARVPGGGPVVLTELISAELQRSRLEGRVSLEGAELVLVGDREQLGLLFATLFGCVTSSGRRERLDVALTRVPGSARVEVRSSGVWSPPGGPSPAGIAIAERIAQAHGGSVCLVVSANPSRWSLVLHLALTAGVGC